MIRKRTKEVLPELKDTRFQIEDCVYRREVTIILNCDYRQSRRYEESGDLVPVAVDPSGAKLFLRAAVERFDAQRRAKKTASLLMDPKRRRGAGTVAPTVERRATTAKSSRRAGRGASAPTRASTPPVASAADPPGVDSRSAEVASPVAPRPRRSTLLIPKEWMDDDEGT